MADIEPGWALQAGSVPRVDPATERVERARAQIECNLSQVDHNLRTAIKLIVFSAACVVATLVIALLRLAGVW